VIFNRGFTCSRPEPSRGETVPIWYAAETTIDQAETETELGNFKQARDAASLALQLTPDSEGVKASAAFAFARVGDNQRAETLINQAGQQSPLNLLLNKLSLPAARAAVSLHQNDPAAAIQELEPSIPYDLAANSSFITLYLRGLAYLGNGSANEAVAQFQRVIDHRGTEPTSLYWSLAHFQLARTYAKTGDLDKSQAKYREFLALWKDADPDIPILKEAKAEYAKLLQ